MPKRNASSPKGGSPKRSPKRGRASDAVQTMAVTAAMYANSYEVQASKTADKLRPLVDAGHLRPGPAALIVKCKGQGLPTSATLSADLRITLDDDQSTPIKSVNELKSFVYSMHGVQGSTNPWMTVFHGDYSLHELRAWLAADAAPRPPPAAPVPVEEAPADEDDTGDSPEVTALTLTAPGCAYQQVLAALRQRTKHELEVDIVLSALRDVIVSADPVAGEALDRLFAHGAPKRCPEGEVPLTVLAARQPMHGAYVDVLVALACVHADFDEQDTNTGETASTILNTRGPPGFYLQYLRERAHAINSGADAAFE